MVTHRLNAAQSLLAKRGGFGNNYVVNPGFFLGRSGLPQTLAPADRPRRSAQRRGGCGSRAMSSANAATSSGGTPYPCSGAG